MKTLAPIGFHHLFSARPALPLVDFRTPKEYTQARNHTLDPRQFFDRGTRPKTHPVDRGAARPSSLGRLLSLAAGSLMLAGLPADEGEGRTISLGRPVRIAAAILALAGVLLGYFVHRYFFSLSAFVSAGLIFAFLSDWGGRTSARTRWNEDLYF